MFKKFDYLEKTPADISTISNPKLIALHKELMELEFSCPSTGLSFQEVDDELIYRVEDLKEIPWPYKDMNPVDIDFQAEWDRDQLD